MGMYHSTGSLVAHVQDQSQTRYQVPQNNQSLTHTTGADVISYFMFKKMNLLFTSYVQCCQKINFKGFIIE